MNISRKIREIPLLEKNYKLKFESNFFETCDKYCFPFMYIYKNVKTFVTRETHTHTHKHIKIYPRWNAMSHREGNREGISSDAEREGRGEVEKRKFLCFLLISNSRSRRSSWRHSRRPVISSKFDSIMKCKEDRG